MFSNFILNLWRNERTQDCNGAVGTGLVEQEPDH